MMKHLLKSIKYGMFTAIVATMVSCDLSVFYNDNYTIKDKVWAIDDKAVFDVDVDKEDISNSYNFFVDLRNTKDYPYSNAFLFIKTIFPDGGYALDTMECPLTEASGKWLGKVSSNHVDNRFYLRKNTIFPQEGLYRFEITHALRDTNVVGIEHIGLRIEYMEQ
ncbi:MAG: gliding motility lipoprotein GldH [Bacteroidales bacterium]|nr:gliding motility lipoprotein GldH [Bacteroidales bacterium]